MQGDIVSCYLSPSNWNCWSASCILWDTRQLANCKGGCASNNMLDVPHFVDSLVCLVIANWERGKYPVCSLWKLFLSRRYPWKGICRLYCLICEWPQGWAVTSDPSSHLILAALYSAPSLEWYLLSSSAAFRCRYWLPWDQDDGREIVIIVIFSLVFSKQCN